MTTRFANELGSLAAWLVVLAATGTLEAGIIATNENVPAVMNAAGGTENDPCIYIYDNYTKVWTNAAIVVGSTLPWNRLEIKNGATISTTQAYSYIGGDTAGADYNQMIVTGMGTTLGFGGEVRVGSRGSYNHWTIQDKASVVVAAVLYLGRQNTTPTQGNYNTLLLDDATLVVTGKVTVGYASNNVRNAITIRRGGTLSINGASANGLSVGRYGAYGDVTINGTNSVLSVPGNLMLGESGTLGAHHNTLTLQNHGLLKLTNATASVTISAAADQGGSYVRFADGFLAWNGNHTNGLNVVTQVQLWDGTAYVSPASTAAAQSLGWHATLYTADAAGEDAALAATGYNGLGGYSVFTGGKPLAGSSRGTIVSVR